METDIQLVACNLANEEYGVDIRYVQEIIRLLDITRVPHAPHFIEGVINLRGMVIPVLDLRTLFNKSPRSNTEATRIIIINAEEVLLGIIVDSVSEVITLPKSQIEPAPTVSNNQNSTYFTGVGKLGERLLILLNIEEILNAVTNYRNP
ncbi:chemotaxis protein CheW [Thermincola ferriacetica]